MAGDKAVVGVFTYLDDVLKAIAKVKSAQLDFRAYAPFGCPEITEAADEQRSPVRYFNITGALTGLVFGFALAILCSLDYPLRVSAKDVVSIPGFVVIGYECTILFGGLATLLAVLHFCRLPDILRKVGYDPRFTDDKFGIVVSCTGSQSDDVQSTLKSCGADEVQVKDGL
ncbi:MAG: DUF3341 domain-containing protein [Oligoflexia bacterium]|nr:DUF3341 domain-containing protein [Oligoflexia bacterium]